MRYSRGHPFTRGVATAALGVVLGTGVLELLGRLDDVVRWGRDMALDARVTVPVWLATAVVVLLLAVLDRGLLRRRRELQRFVLAELEGRARSAEQLAADLNAKGFEVNRRAVVRAFRSLERKGRVDSIPLEMPRKIWRAIPRGSDRDSPASPDETSVRAGRQTDRSPITE